MMVFIFLLSLNISPKVNKANKLYEEGKYEEAYELYKEASILHPENDKIKFNLGDCAYRMERLREAGDIFMNLTGSENDEVKLKSLYNLGNTFLSAGKYREAISMYKRVLMASPSNEKAKRNLEIAREKLEEQKKKEKQEDKEDDKERNQKQKKKKTGSTRLKQALKDEQKETLRKALKRRAGGRKEEEGKW